MTSNFDANRAILLDEPSPEAFSVQAYLPLAQAIEKNAIYAKEPCLIAMLGDTALVLPTLALVYYHVAQGNYQNQAWMVTYCCLCNAGTLFDATLNEQTFHFAAHGFYDVMVLIADDESKSYWNHLTGECVEGKSKGSSLKRLSALRQTTAQQALIEYPDAVYTTINMTQETNDIAEDFHKRFQLPDSPDYGALYETLGAEDTRLPQYDMGLGIWTKNTQRYYPMSKLYESNSIVFDEIDGRKVIVCVDDEIGLPTAFYHDARESTQRGGEIFLGDQDVYRKGILYRDGEAVQVERPNYNTIRWHGFASLFPNCEIYGQTS